MQNQQPSSMPQLPTEDTIKYFSPKRHTGKITTIVVSIIMAVICIFAVNSIGVIYTIIMVLFFSALGVYNYFAIKKYKKTIPVPDQYEGWLSTRVQAMYRRELRQLGIDENQISEPVIFFHSCVLPGSDAAKHYPPEHLHIKGRDNQWHFSVNVYTYFILTSFDISVIMFDVDAFDPKYHASEYNKNIILSYDAIKSVEKFNDDDIVIYNGQEYACQADTLCLRISDNFNTETIDVTAAIKATFTLGDNGVTVSFEPNRGLKRKMNQLQHIILKNQRRR